ncbi:MAG: hypothetical protein AAGD11_06875 [Planctomycetota bacterium]
MDDSPTFDSSPLSLRDKRTALGLPAANIADDVSVVNLPRGPLAKSIAKVRNSLSVWGFVDQGVVSIASFAAAAIVGRACGSIELGIYTLAVRIFWLAAGIPNALIWMPYTSRAPRMNRTRQKYFLGSATVHLLLIVLGIATVLVGVAIVPLLGLSDKQWLLPMCLALIPFSTLMLLREHLRRYLLAHMQTASLLKVDVPIAACQLLILAGLAWTQKLSAVSALLGMAVGCGWGVLWVALHRDRFRVASRRVAAHWGHNFQFGKWLLVVSIAWLVSDASYYWLVESFHGLTAMGQFSAAAITVMLFNPVLLTVQNLSRSVLSNSYAQGGSKELREKTMRGSGAVVVGFGVLFVGLAISGGTLVELAFGDEFAGLGAIVASLCLGMYLQVCFVPIEAGLTALQDGKGMLAGSLLRLALILASGIPLIAWYGAIGVGFAMAIGSFGAGMLQWKFFHRRCPRAD